MYELLLIVAVCMAVLAVAALSHGALVTGIALLVASLVVGPGMLSLRWSRVNFSH